MTTETDTKIIGVVMTYAGNKQDIINAYADRLARGDDENMNEYRSIAELHLEYLEDYADNVGEAIAIDPIGMLCETSAYNVATDREQLSADKEVTLSDDDDIDDIRDVLESAGHTVLHTMGDWILISDY